MKSPQTTEKRHQVIFGFTKMEKIALEKMALNKQQNGKLNQQHEVKYIKDKKEADQCLAQDYICLVVMRTIPYLSHHSLKGIENKERKSKV